MMQPVESNEPQAAVPEYSGGRVEPADPAAVMTVDESSGYAPAANATEPVVLVAEGSPDPAAFVRGVEAAQQASSAVAASVEADTLPPVPEGVVVEESEGVSLDLGGEEASETMRFLGSPIGPEVDFISPEPGESSFEEVMIQLVDGALEGLEGSEEPMTGEKVAQIFCRGDVQDARVTFLLSLLAQNQPVTAELVLSVVRAQGESFEELVDGAILVREELARAGETSVEQLSSEGWQRAEAPGSGKPESQLPTSPRASVEASP